MAGIAKAFVQGNLTADPEKRETKGGTTVCSFGVAVNDVWTNQDGDKQEEVHFFDIVVFGKQGENCAKYLNKGDEVTIDGTLRQGRWETDEGDKRSKVEIKGDNVVFGRKASGKGDAPAEAVPANA